MIRCIVRKQNKKGKPILRKTVCPDGRLKISKSRSAEQNASATFAFPRGAPRYPSVAQTVFDCKGYPSLILSHKNRILSRGNFVTNIGVDKLIFVNVAKRLSLLNNWEDQLNLAIISSCNSRGRSTKCAETPQRRTIRSLYFSGFC